MALLMTIPAAIMLNRAAEHKKLVATSILLARVMFLPIVALVYLPSESMQAWAIIS
ncbi:hypothetical protein C8K15_11614 [Paenisporosarcina sp. OV554]|nr:hypothetical protein C8K15_11614 [Paenisporosarcina sp. OV554]